MTVKERVLRAVQALPDGATPDDVLAQVRTAVASAGENGASGARTAPGEWGSALAYLESAQVSGPPDWSERWEEYLAEDERRRSN
jgi:hypothetical protein